MARASGWLQHALVPPIPVACHACQSRPAGMHATGHSHPALPDPAPPWRPQAYKPGNNAGAGPALAGGPGGKAAAAAAAAVAAYAARSKDTAAGCFGRSSSSSSRSRLAGAHGCVAASRGDGAGEVAVVCWSACVPRAVVVVAGLRAMPQAGLWALDPDGPLLARCLGVVAAAA